MATLRAVRNRISGIRKTQKITRAMKMVAASKLRKAQSRVIAARPYARKMKELLEHLSTVGDVASADFIAPRPLKTLGLVVVTSDRGFCGAFNANIIKAAVNHIGSQPQGVAVKLVCVGKKGLDFFLKRRYTVVGRHVGVYAHLGFQQAQVLAGELVAGYRTGEFDRIDIMYNEFKSIAQQRITVEQFLPIPATAAAVSGRHPVDYIYEPGCTEILLSIIPRHLSFLIWRALLESNTAEEGSRMAAMENATENANELVSMLQLQYNKARQAAITKELLEVVSGAEALVKAG